ncbi:MAG TPA: helix-turn-helix transcriptional regulator [Candidatus Thermoplasmatota archaeon]|nr:helix-turn-helix transcriptional regulator [Candidatus Thermoplasmatota archaeon]
MAITAVPEAVLDNQIRIAGQLAVSADPGPVARALRERAGFTQEELATLLRMRRESLSRIEGGKVAPSTGFIQRLASIMALSHAAREHLAECDARGAAVDDAYLQRLAAALRLDRVVADEAILAAMMAYEHKKRGLLKVLEEKS